MTCDLEVIERGSEGGKFWDPQRGSALYFFLQTGEQKRRPAGYARYISNTIRGRGPFEYCHLIESLYLCSDIEEFSL